MAKGVTITEEKIRAMIKHNQYAKMGEKTTVCLMTLKNGFEVVGTAACVDPANFDAKLGEQFSFKKAFDKVWELEGYRLQCAEAEKKGLVP